MPAQSTMPAQSDRPSLLNPHNGRPESNVRISTPLSVISSVCSYCAHRLPSVVTYVHLSGQHLPLVVPRLRMGSIVNVCPTCRNTCSHRSQQQSCSRGLCAVDTIHLQAMAFMPTPTAARQCKQCRRQLASSRQGVGLQEVPMPGAHMHDVRLAVGGVHHRRRRVEDLADAVAAEERHHPDPTSHSNGFCHIG